MDLQKSFKLLTTIKNLLGSILIQSIRMMSPNREKALLTPSSCIFMEEGLSLWTQIHTVITYLNGLKVLDTLFSQLIIKMPQEESSLISLMKFGRLIAGSSNKLCLNLEFCQKESFLQEIQQVAPTA